jgi:hypothetical protein
MPDNVMAAAKRTQNLNSQIPIYVGDQQKLIPTTSLMGNRTKVYVVDGCQQQKESVPVT